MKIKYYLTIGALFIVALGLLDSQAIIQYAERTLMPTTQVTVTADSSRAVGK